MHQFKRYGDFTELIFHSAGSHTNKRIDRQRDRHWQAARRQNLPDDSTTFADGEGYVCIAIFCRISHYLRKVKRIEPKFLTCPFWLLKSAAHHFRRLCLSLPVF